jgi:hypothetical protein
MHTKPWHPNSVNLKFSSIEYRTALEDSVEDFVKKDIIGILLAYVDIC